MVFFFQRERQVNLATREVMCHLMKHRAKSRVSEEVRRKRCCKVENDFQGPRYKIWRVVPREWEFLGYPGSEQCLNISLVYKEQSSLSMLSR